MPKFNVVCRNADGQTVSGPRFSVSREALLAELRQSGLTPISVEPAEQAGPAAEGRARRRAIWGRGVRLSELAVGFRALATMLGAGLPIIDCLVDVAEQSDNPRFREAMLGVAGEVRKGSMLSGAMRGYPRVFSPLMCSLVQAGEESGTLSEVLAGLAQYLESMVALRRRIKVSTAYPLFIVGFFCVAVSVIFLVILPKFAAIFAQTGVELPLPTRVVLFMSGLFTAYLLPGLGVLVAAGVCLYLWGRTESGAKAMDSLKLRLPALGRLFSLATMARFTRTLSLVIRSGIPVVQSLALCSTVGGNRILRENIEQVREQIVRGGSLSDELASRPIFPRMLVRMAAAGEASGQLADMLERVADYFSQEVAARVEIMMALLEPALLAVIGALIGIVVIAIYLPIFSLAKTIV